MTAASVQAAVPLPGSRFPLGATVGMAGRIRGGLRRRRRDGALPVRRGRRRDAGSAVDYDAGVWHGFVPGVGPGQAYGYRATGPYDPARGAALQPAQAPARPLCAGLHRDGAFGPEVLGTRPATRTRRARLDSAGPRAAQPRRRTRRTAGATARRPGPYADTVIYEVHVKGFTMRHPGVPAELRGTYAGLAHEAAIGHLLDLGVTAVELLPVHESVPEAFLVQRGLTNYWGYNTIGYFAPHQGYSAAVRAGTPGGQVTEFKAMVDALHRAGLEVMLDVVFNHTAEGDSSGPRCASGAWTTPRTTGWTRATRAITSTRPARQLTQRRRPAHPAADHGLAAVLADRDARGRVPVRPGAHPGPPGGRVRPEVGVLRHGRAGSGRVAGEADRRTVGRRADGQLRPGPVPGRSGGSGTASTATACGTSGAASRSASASSRPVLRVGGPVRRRPAAADRLGEPDHRARRVHPARPGLLRRQAQRGQRRVQPGRDQRQPLVELRRGGPDRDPTCWRCARASPGRC